MRTIYYQFLTFLLFLFLSPVLFSQSQSTQIEALLQSDAVTYAQAARFILDAAEKYTASNQEDAFQYAAQRGWLPKNASPVEAARLDGVSLLFMNAFDIKGGLFYSIFKSPRYAYRELVYRSFIQGRTAPGMKVSGELLLFVIGRGLAAQEASAALSAEQERLRAEEAERLRREAEEAARLRAEAEEAERLRREAEEAARLRAEAEEQERLRLEAEEAARLRELADEAALAEEQERLRREAEEAARLRAQAEEAERLRREAEEAARLRAQAEEQERLRREAEEAARLRALAEQSARPRMMSEADALIWQRVSVVQFQPDSTRILPDEIPKLSEMARILKTIPGARILVEGHTADTGARAHELDISLQRADIIAGYLADLGVSRQDIIITGCGPDYPVAGNDTEEGMAANRRVEVKFIYEDTDRLRAMSIADAAAWQRASVIQFQPDSALMVPGDLNKLDEIARILRTIPGARILVAGHTANTGARAHELDISLQRANIAADYLMRLGVRPQDIIVTGFGPDYPVADNGTEDGMAANRRAEVTIVIAE